MFKKLLLFVLSSLLLFLSENSLAGANFLITNVPQAREKIVIPEGITNCYNVAAGFSNGVWIAAHRVCQSADGMWIAPHYRCYNVFNGRCTRWRWHSSYYVQPGVVEFGVVWPHPPYYYHRHDYHGEWHRSSGWGPRPGPYYHGHHGWGPGPAPRPGPDGGVYHGGGHHGWKPPHH